MSQFKSNEATSGSMSRLPAELLLLTFANLEYLDLFRCQMVCRKWHTLISHEHSLRNAMFLEGEEVSAYTPRYKPILVFEFERAGLETSGNDCYTFHTRDGTPRRISGDGSGPYYFDPSYRFHPILPRLCSFLSHLNPNFSCQDLRADPHKAKSKVVWTEWEDLVGNLRVQQAPTSWRNMYISLPPVSKFLLEVSWHIYAEGEGTVVCFETAVVSADVSGVKLGQVVDKLQEEIVRCLPHVKDISTDKEDILQTSVDMIHLCRG
ncbi:hypothetical protein BDV96DRAFT_186851 [Lophiotrema nucula]|uniref:F-box domain-containing protein n=1 Tax=Lophiotrema nucula TaxID=690887 RepID=A0A6A5YYE8_9PLEO|nr:hypothetical protein BDV96DRAFT_186851 [Lophiotrema nucula]